MSPAGTQRADGPAPLFAFPIVNFMSICRLAQTGANMGTAMESAVRKLMCAVAGVVGLTSVAAQSAPFDSLYLFGDSLLDSGNSYLLTGGVYPVSPPYAGVFSNGPVASQVLAARLGLPLVPSVLGGNNFATNGSTSNSENIAGDDYGTGLGIDAIKPLVGIGLEDQVDAFQSRNISPDGLSDALFVVWAGANDAFMLGSQLEQYPPPPDVDIGALFFQAGLSAAQHVENEILQLAAAGAQTMLIGNLPNLAHLPITPDVLDPAFEAFLFAFSTQFLDAEFFAALAAANPTTQIKLFDAYGLFEEAVAGGFGFANTTDPCLPTLGPFPADAPCGDPDSYLFWDSIHPTAKAHQILGNAMYAAVVPEPHSLLLIALTLGGIAIARRRRAAD